MPLVFISSFQPMRECKQEYSVLIRKLNNTFDVILQGDNLMDFVKCYKNNMYNDKCQIIQFLYV